MRLKSFAFSSTPVSWAFEHTTKDHFKKTVKNKTVQIQSSQSEWKKRESVKMFSMSCVICMITHSVEKRM